MVVFAACIALENKRFYIHFINEFFGVAKTLGEQLTEVFDDLWILAAGNCRHLSTT